MEQGEDDTSSPPPSKALVEPWHRDDLFLNSSLGILLKKSLQFFFWEDFIAETVEKM